MKLSTRSRYGLRLILDIGINGIKNSVKLSESSKRQNISLKYLGQITIQLKNAGFIRSERGIRGGYRLSRNPDKINIYDLIKTLEGGIDLTECLNDRKCSREKNCVTKKLWKIVSDNIKNSLNKLTLQDLIDWSKQDSSYDYYI